MSSDSSSLPGGRLPRRVGVLGFGVMGSGIVQVFAQAGFEVVVWDRDEAALAAGWTRLTDFTGAGVARGKLTPREQHDLLARVRRATELDDLAGSGVVVEAVVEDLAVKRAVLGRVAEVVGAECVLATNTSALSVTALAAALPVPGRVAGLHFFNPAPLMSLVEVVAAMQTAQPTLDLLVALVERAGKDPVVVRDRPGFLLNRVLMPYLNDVVQAYDDGLASAADIDTAVRLGLGHPLGPLELLDLIGLDVHAHATEAAYQATRDPAYAVPPLLTRMVEAGWYGRKSGRGFRHSVEEQ